MHFPSWSLPGCSLVSFVRYLVPNLVGLTIVELDLSRVAVASEERTSKSVEFISGKWSSAKVTDGEAQNQAAA